LGQAIGVKLIFELLLEGKTREMDMFETPKESRIIGFVASLSWLLLHPDTNIASAVAEGMRTHHNWDISALSFVKEGCVPILWLAEHASILTSRTAKKLVYGLRNHLIERRCTMTRLCNPGLVMDAVTKCSQMNLKLALLLFAVSTPNISRLQKERLWVTAAPCEVNLLRVAISLMTHPGYFAEGFSYSITGQCRIGLVALIRSDRGDIKMSLPRLSVLRKISLLLASLFEDTRVTNNGELPVLRGDYATWDYLFTTLVHFKSLDNKKTVNTTANNFELYPLDLLVEMFSVSRCYQCELAVDIYSALLLDRIITNDDTAASIVISALKHGAPRLAVDACCQIISSSRNSLRHSPFDACIAALICAWLHS